MFHTRKPLSLSAVVGQLLGLSAIASMVLGALLALLPLGMAAQWEYARRIRGFLADLSQRSVAAQR